MSARLVGLSFLLLLASQLETVAQQPDAEKPRELSAWQKRFRQQAADYQLLVGDDTEPAKVSKEPILFWTQPVRGGDDGAVYLWTHKGQPTAIGTFFIWPTDDGRQGVTHELHSLTDLQLRGQWHQRMWNVKAGSLGFQPIAGSEPPAQTAERRLLQMKKITRDFTATSLGKDEKKWELRLLPRPLYRYEVDAKDKAPVTDGALFGFVQGTDLEIVVALEAVSSEKGPAWRCAFARMSDLPLVVEHKEKVVWTRDRANFDQSGNIYYCGTVEYVKQSPAE
jgi:hypothetical protein